MVLGPEVKRAPKEERRTQSRTPANRGSGQRHVCPCLQKMFWPGLMDSPFSCVGTGFLRTAWSGEVADLFLCCSPDRTLDYRWTPRFRALARGFCAPPGVVRLQICFCVVVQTGPLIIAGPAKIFLKAEQSFCFVCSRFLARHNAARLCAEKARRGNAAQDLATEVSHSLGQIIF